MTCYDALARWGRHDRDCVASGSFNLDERCTCGFVAACLKLNQEGNPPLGFVTVKRVELASIMAPEELRD